MNNPLDTFEALLCELLQFDCSGLDFGIYHIMNRKREAIERFIKPRQGPMKAGGPNAEGSPACCRRENHDRR